MPQAAPSARTERYETIVIGGGQAGLAAGYELQRRGVDFLILEAAGRIGDSWRRRWDSLTLFTPAKHSGLPGMPFPAAPGYLPRKDEVGDYLDAYAARFELPVRLRARVRSLRRAGGRYEVLTGDLRYESTSVVVATGPYQSPRIPALADFLSPRIQQLHSSAYVNPTLLSSGATLVVGAGASGSQIAMELSTSRKVWLAGRAVGQAPRTLLGRDLYDWFWPVLSRVTTDSVAGRRLRERAHRGDPLIGLSRRDVVASGVIPVGRVMDVERGLPVCDGVAVPAEVVVWATGFRPDLQWIDLPILDANGFPHHRGGVVDGELGLYFLGLRFQRSYTSALIGGVGRDAALIAERIAGPAQSSRDSRARW
jgi:putative flavoprotein involved in K+ transport